MPKWEKLDEISAGLTKAPYSLRRSQSLKSSGGSWAIRSVKWLA